MDYVLPMVGLLIVIGLIISLVPTLTKQQDNDCLTAAEIKAIQEATAKKYRERRDSGQNGWE